jgi:outer membrane protein assembly factor BamD (BamD/ComL family)
MTIDKIKEQEQLPEIMALKKCLKQVRIPYKSEPERSAIESTVFCRMTKPESQQSLFNSFFLKPAAVLSLCALIAVVSSVSYLNFRHEPVRNTAYTDVLSIHGKVIVSSRDNKNSLTSFPVNNNDRIAINSGTVITTYDNSSYIICLDSGSMIDVSPDTKLTFETFNVNKIIIRIEKGSVLAKISKRRSGQDFIINTPNASCIVVGTIFKVDVFDTAAISKTRLSVYEGKVRFVDKNNEVQTVSSGQGCCASVKFMDAMYVLNEPQTPFKAISTLELLARPGSTQNPCGIMDISSSPDNAIVMIDDSVVGRTPIIIKKTVGNHKLTIVRQGYPAWEKLIDIGMDSTMAVSANLTIDSVYKKESSGPRHVSIPEIAACPESTFVAYPEYVEAMIQLTIGEYQKAVGVFESIKENEAVDLKSRMVLLKKINSCYAKIGNFTKVAENLSIKADKASCDDDKGQYLWQLANVQANCIGDFHGAELTLIRLIEINTWGKRTRQAFCKLAEVQYMQDKLDDAIATYKVYLQRFPDDLDRERSMYNLAYIMNYDLKNYREALKLYTKLIDSYPSGKYYKISLFDKAECAAKTGKIQEAEAYYKKYIAIDPKGKLSTVCTERLKLMK